MTGLAASAGPAIWASLPTPALIVDAADRIRDANPAAEAFFNASIRAMLGQPVLDRLLAEAPLVETFARLRAGHQAMFIHTTRVQRADRTETACDIQAALVEGQPGMILLLITPQELSGHIDRAQALGASSRSAIGMAEMLAHEIKNPLAGIAGAAQLLDMTLSAEDRELTGLIVAETRRIVKLLEQVEQFGNLLPPAKVAVNIHDVLDRARKSAALGFANGMRIFTDYDPSLPPVPGDADQLLQVFLNLLKNAAEASGNAGGTIRIRSFYDQALRIRGKDGRAAALPINVEVVDDGPGIPPEIADAIFDPFVSGRENGTGLGLALVAKIIADHGGWISVQSVPGRTAFRISLPVLRDTHQES